jgi:hypothetical protein
MICSSACSQSDVNFQALPSQVWIRAQAARMWSLQDVLIGRITQQELDYLVGLSRQRVNEALTTMQAEGVIRVEYGELRF